MGPILSTCANFTACVIAWHLLVLIFAGSYGVYMGLPHSSSRQHGCRILMTSTCPNICPAHADCRQGVVPSGTFKGLQTSIGPGLQEERSWSSHPIVLQVLEAVLGAATNIACTCLYYRSLYFIITCKLYIYIYCNVEKQSFFNNHTVLR